MFELIQEYPPHNFCCHCCRMMIYRLTNENSMYEDKDNGVILCRNCYQGTDSGRLTISECQTCYEYSHFNCDCCRKEFVIKNNGIRDKRENEEESNFDTCWEGNNFKILCENCIYGTNEGTEICKYCHYYSYFACNCCDKEFFANDDPIRNKYNEEMNGGDKKTQLHIYKIKNHNEGENEFNEGDEIIIMCEKCAYGTGCGIKVCRYCLK